MTELLHSPALWALIVLVGVIGLGADLAWSSWTFPGRVEDPARLWPRPAPARQPFAVGPSLPPGWRPLPQTGDGWRYASLPIYMDEPTPAAPPENDGLGATAQWSPIAEVESGGRSLEDWWSERLQEFDDALKWIDTVPRLPDGTGAFVVLGDNVCQELESFVSGSMRLGAYRALRLEHTGEFSAADRRELASALAA